MILCANLGRVGTCLQRTRRCGAYDNYDFSSRDFNQDTSRAKKAAADGPVFITDRGKPAHVLLTIEQYRRIAGAPRTIADALAMPGFEDVAFDPPRIALQCREVDLG